MHGLVLRARILKLCRASSDFVLPSTWMSTPVNVTCANMATKKILKFLINHSNRKNMIFAYHKITCSQQTTFSFIHTCTIQMNTFH